MRRSVGGHRLLRVHQDGRTHGSRDRAEGQTRTGIGRAAGARRHTAERAGETAVGRDRNGSLEEATTRREAGREMAREAAARRRRAATATEAPALQLVRAGKVAG